MGGMMPGGPGAPGGAPPGMSAPGAPPAMPPPAGPPAMGPPGGLAALMGGAPPTSPYADLPSDLPHHYQLLDVANRQLKKAIASGGFYKEPEVLAAIRHWEGEIAKVIATYARAGIGTDEASAVQTGVETEGYGNDPEGTADGENVDLEPEGG